MPPDDTRTTRSSGSIPDDVEEIRIRLQHPTELFELAQTDLFSEYRHWMTGMEYAISHAKSRWRQRPIRLILELPPSEITDDLQPKMRRAITRFCRKRIEYNRNEIHATRRDGAGALAIGLCILLIGMALAQILRTNLPYDWSNVFLADGLFLVVAWVGMWYPLDTLVYYARPYQIENRALERLIDAELVLEPHRRDDGDEGGG